MREDVLQVAEKLEQLAAGIGASLSQFALAWVLRQPGVSSALIGSSRPSQIEENVKAVELKLTDDVLTQTEAILAEVREFAPLR
jgi:aryl-alcohol dehydrogenase-like predicted oxidoreductase